MKNRTIEIFGLLLFLAALGCTSVYQRQYDLYYRISDWEGAERVLRKAMVENPDDPEIYFLLGQACGYGEKYKEMDEAFQRSLSLSDRYGTEIDQLRDFFVVTQLNKGIESYNRGEYEASIAELLQVGTIDREESRHYRYLGLNYSKIGEFEEAARNLKLSADLNRDLESRIEPVRVYGILERYPGVIEVSEGILDEEPDRLDILRLAAVAYEREDNPEKAIESYERVVRLSPEDTAAMYNLALLLCLVDRKDEAVPILGQLSVQEPESLQVHYSVCSLLYDTGRYEESLVCFEGYRERDPVDVQTLRHLFVLNRMLSRLDEAKRIKQQMELLDAISAEMESGFDNTAEIQ